jgi:hypothetical protein
VSDEDIANVWAQTWQEVERRLLAEPPRFRSGADIRWFVASGCFPGEDRDPMLKDTPDDHLITWFVYGPPDGGNPGADPDPQAPASGPPAYPASLGDPREWMPRGRA